MILQARIFGGLLGATLGTRLVSQGNALGLSTALMSLGKIAARDSGRSALLSLGPPDSGSCGDVADAVLACLPVIFLEFAEAPSQFAERVTETSLLWTGEAETQQSVLPCSGVLAALLGLPARSPLPRISLEIAAESTVRLALRYFLEAAEDYRTCLRRMARDRQATPALAALTGTLLGIYQGPSGIPLSWLAELDRDGTWQELEALAAAAMAYWAGQQHPLSGSAGTVVGPVGSLQARRALQMPSWESSD